MHTNHSITVKLIKNEWRSSDQLFIKIFMRLSPLPIAEKYSAGLDQCVKDSPSMHGHSGPWQLWKGHYSLSCQWSVYKDSLSLHWHDAQWWLQNIWWWLQWENHNGCIKISGKLQWEHLIHFSWDHNDSDEFVMISVEVENIRETP